MSPETILHPGDRVRLVTYGEAFAICGEPKEVYSEIRHFFFPEAAFDHSTGSAVTLSIPETFIREHGGKVLTVKEISWDFGGAHIHYRVEPDMEICGCEGKAFCPAMFSGYEEDEEPERDPLDEIYAEDLFGFLFN